MEGAVLSGRRGNPCRRRVARRSALGREPARDPPLPREAPRRARGRTCATAASVVAAAARGGLPRRAGRALPGRGALPRLGRRPDAARVSEYLRLAFATVVVLAPGWFVARALGQRGASATLAWGLAAVFVAWFVTFAVHGSIGLALGVLLAIGVVAAVFAVRRAAVPRPQ